MEFQNDQQKADFVAALLKGKFTQKQVELGLIYYCDSCNDWADKLNYFGHLCTTADLNHFTDALRYSMMGYLDLERKTSLDIFGNPL